MNPLAAANVKAINKINDDTVEFVIDTVEHPYLADPNVLSACMNAYQYNYPNVTGWQAFIERSQVRILVSGKVRWEALKEN